ncbi:DeoR/GlpR family DNA-binding transcription regulator [Paenibacillus sp.]|uniref:DeoR/GlpR family DNA-binding transcription regulator n=1 Tax=Paenibacillus sp. TaxID=58172 RepID=UPI002D5F30AC|nr:DeoR/GlpR family DNA-binding transcription regulator [Paenibacillus sp.]HZG56717.1 DeoR/GlpR family DNA-binding transcription regulator [Paenibacillus sp.]
MEGANSKETAKDVLFAEERKMEIVQLVQERGKVLVPDLIAHFQVSPATIRNDLRDLEANGLIKRTHGGAIPPDTLKVGFELENQNKTVKHHKQKQAIARRALQFVEDGDIIILDTGTTTLELAKLLKDRRNVTVIVNDIEIARCLEDFEGVQVVIIGGTLRKKFHCTIGPFAANLLSELNVDKAFLGTNGFSLQKGCTTPDINQAEIKRIMVKISSQVIVLCDSSKIGANSFVQFASPEQIDAFVTDDDVKPGVVEEFAEQGLELIIAK